MGIHMVHAGLPGSKCEPSTPAPSTRSHSVSLRTVHPRGTAGRQREMKSEIHSKTRGRWKEGLSLSRIHSEETVLIGLNEARFKGQMGIIMVE